MKTVKDYIRTIVDFPHEGILFRDVTTLFADPRGFRMAIDQMLHPYAGMQIDKVVGLEARGFILGGAIAHQLSVGFVPVRKKGKLPGAVISEEYTLEYGEAIIEIHDDAIQAGEKILVVDDLLADILGDIRDRRTSLLWLLLLLLWHSVVFIHRCAVLGGIRDRTTSLLWLLLLLLRTAQRAGRGR